MIAFASAITLAMIPAADVQAADRSPAGEPYIAPAGRSPIPEPGETITKPIPPVRLEAPKEGVAPEPGKTIRWDQAAKHLGYEVTVQGKIVDTHMLRSGAICFLNFDKDWQDKFYLAMFRSAFSGMPEPPNTYYLGKAVRVTGRVTTHNGRPQIEIRDIDQIDVVKDMP